MAESCISHAQSIGTGRQATGRYFCSGNFNPVFTPTHKLAHSRIDTSSCCMTPWWLIISPLRKWEMGKKVVMEKSPQGGGTGKVLWQPLSCAPRVAVRWDRVRAGPSGVVPRAPELWAPPLAVALTHSFTQRSPQRTCNHLQACNAGINAGWKASIVSLPQRLSFSRCIPLPAHCHHQLVVGLKRDAVLWFALSGSSGRWNGERKLPSYVSPCRVSGNVLTIQANHFPHPQSGSYVHPLKYFEWPDHGWLFSIWKLGNFFSVQAGSQVIWWPGYRYQMKTWYFIVHHNPSAMYNLSCSQFSLFQRE